MVGQRGILIAALSVQRGPTDGRPVGVVRVWAEEVAINLLGAPTDRTSKQLRWGRRGSLVVHIAGPRIGRFYNFETGEGGDLLDLIQWKLGIPLRDALAFMRDFRARGPASAPDESVSRRTASPEQRWSAKGTKDLAFDDPLAGTLGEAYLRTRCCHVPHVDDLRFLVGSRTHPPSLVARVTDLHTGEPMSLHFLRLIWAPTRSAGWDAQIWLIMLLPAGSCDWPVSSIAERPLALRKGSKRRRR